MRNRQLILTSVASAVVVLAVTVLAVYSYDGRSQLTRIADCVHQAGYNTTITHDDGRVSLAGQDPDIQLLFGGSDDSMQVRDPSDRIAVTDRDSHTIAVMTLKYGKVTVYTAPTPDAINRCAT